MTRADGLRLVAASEAKVLSRRPLAIVFLRTRVVVRWPDDSFSDGEADALARIMSGGM